MPAKPYSALIEILRSLLERVEKEDPNDPVSAELKRSLLRKLAMLENRY
jgi:hypothetical protein